LVYRCHRFPPVPAPLFPYTTLFRSGIPGGGGGSCLPAAVETGPDQAALGRPPPGGSGNAATRIGIDRALTAGDRQLVIDIEAIRSEEHTSELQSREKLVCRLLLEKK